MDDYCTCDGGNDTFTLSDATGHTVNGGGGQGDGESDTVYLAESFVTISESGENFLISRGIAHTITDIEAIVGGASNNTFSLAKANARLTLDGGGGSNELRFTEGSNFDLTTAGQINSTTASGDVNMTVRNFNRLDLFGETNTVTIGVDSYQFLELWGVSSGSYDTLVFSGTESVGIDLDENEVLIGGRKRFDINNFDIFKGGSGNDTFRGREGGYATFTGGEGADTFYISAGTDTITDFTADDKLNFGSYNIVTGIDDLTFAITDDNDMADVNGGNLRISYSGGQVTLLDVKDTIIDGINSVTIASLFQDKAEAYFGAGGDGAGLISFGLLAGHFPSSATITGREGNNILVNNVSGAINSYVNFDNSDWMINDLTIGGNRFVVDNVKTLTLSSVEGYQGNGGEDHIRLGDTAKIIDGDGGNDTVYLAERNYTISGSGANLLIYDRSNRVTHTVTNVETIYGRNSLDSNFAMPGVLHDLTLHAGNAANNYNNDLIFTEGGTFDLTVAGQVRQMTGRQTNTMTVRNFDSLLLSGETNTVTIGANPDQFTIITAFGRDDTLKFTGPESVDIDFLKNRLTIGTDAPLTIFRFEHAIGGDGDDTFKGSSRSNTFTGGGGDDTFTLIRGTDTITDFTLADPDMGTDGDTLRLAWGSDGFADMGVTYELSDSGDDLIISYVSDRVTLQGQNFGLSAESISDKIIERLVETGAVLLLREDGARHSVRNTNDTFEGSAGDFIDAVLFDSFSRPMIYTLTDDGFTIRPRGDLVSVDMAGIPTYYSPGDVIGTVAIGDGIDAVGGSSFDDNFNFGTREFSRYIVTTGRDTITAGYHKDMIFDFTRVKGFVRGSLGTMTPQDEDNSIITFTASDSTHTISVIDADIFASDLSDSDRFITRPQVFVYNRRDVTGDSQDGVISSIHLDGRGVAVYVNLSDGVRTITWSDGTVNTVNTLSPNSIYRARDNNINNGNDFRDSTRTSVQNIDWVIGTGFTYGDFIFGNNNANVFSNIARDSTLYGLGGADVFSNIGNRSKLYGGEGADVFYNIGSSSVLTGGADADVFHFSGTLYQIRDFEIGTDTIHVGARWASNDVNVVKDASGVGSNVNFNGSPRIHLMNVTFNEDNAQAILDSIVGAPKLTADDIIKPTVLTSDRFATNMIMIAKVPFLKDGVTHHARIRVEAVDDFSLDPDDYTVLDYSGASARVRVNLSGTKYSDTGDGQPDDSGYNYFAVVSGSGATSQTRIDDLSNGANADAAARAGAIEHIIGGSGNDLLIGNDLDNVIDPGASHAGGSLYALSESYRAASLVGGGGADTFVINAIHQDAIGAQREYVIRDFKIAEGDKLDFRRFGVFGEDFTITGGVRSDGNSQLVLNYEINRTDVTQTIIFNEGGSSSSGASVGLISGSSRGAVLSGAVLNDIGIFADSPALAHTPPLPDSTSPPPDTFTATLGGRDFTGAPDGTNTVDFSGLDGIGHVRVNLHDNGRYVTNGATVGTRQAHSVNDTTDNIISAYSLQHIDNISGTINDDFLIGDNNNNVFYSRGGNDIIVGNGGNDMAVLALTGTSVLSYANNTLTVTNAVAMETVTISDVERVKFTSAIDTLTLPNGLSGIIIDGGGGGDTIIGSIDDNQIVYYSESFSYGLQDTVNGNTLILNDEEYTDGVTANIGSFTNVTNTVHTWAGNANKNVFVGNGSDNILEGRGGDDTFNGGSGNDTYTGGDGADIFFGSAGQDVIKDFGTAEGDYLDYRSQTTGSTFDYSNFSFTVVDSGGTIDLNNGKNLRIYTDSGRTNYETLEDVGDLIDAIEESGFGNFNSLAYRYFGDGDGDDLLRADNEHLSQTTSGEPGAPPDFAVAEGYYINFDSRDGDWTFHRFNDDEGNSHAVSFGDRDFLVFEDAAGTTNGRDDLWQALQAGQLDISFADGNIAITIGNTNFAFSKADAPDGGFTNQFGSDATVNTESELQSFISALNVEFA